MIACWIKGHDWKCYDADKRFCTRCGASQTFNFNTAKWETPR